MFPRVAMGVPEGPLCLATLARQAKPSELKSGRPFQLRAQPLLAPGRWPDDSYRQEVPAQGQRSPSPHTYPHGGGLSHITPSRALDKARGRHSPHQENNCHSGPWCILLSPH